MSNSEPEKSRVRPLEDRPSGPVVGGSRWVGTVGAVLAGIGALLVIAVASSPDPSSSIALLDSTTAAPVPSSIVTTEPDTASPTTSVVDPTLGDVIPGTDGALVTATGQGGIALTEWPADGPRRNQVIPMHTGPFLEFDVSGRQLAFLGSSAISDGRTLYVGTSTSWAPLDAATSYRWHETEPDQIAWMTYAESPELCHAVVESGEGVSAMTCVDAPGDLLAGYDQFGYLMLAEDEVLRLDSSGAPVGDAPGSNALVGPDGRALIVTQMATDQRSFSLAGPELEDVSPLDWAPANASGEYGFVAWSPLSADPELAFLVHLDDERWQLQRWSIEGRKLTALNLRGRFWDVGWDSSGRYLLVPGVTDSDHVVVVYDLLGREVTYIPFTGWVQDVELVTTSR